MDAVGGGRYEWILHGDSTGWKVVVASSCAEIRQLWQVVTSRTGEAEYLTTRMSPCGGVTRKEFTRWWIRDGSVPRVLSTTPISITANSKKLVVCLFSCQHFTRLVNWALSLLPVDWPGGALRINKPSSDAVKQLKEAKTRDTNWECWLTDRLMINLSTQTYISHWEKCARKTWREEDNSPWSTDEL